MVDITGHVAFGLLFAVVAWIRWDGRASVLFVGFAALAALLPDVDLWLQALFPAAVHHHGVTHTVVFATLASLLGGVVVAGLFERSIDEWIDDARFDRRNLFVLSFAAFLAGSLSHLVADMLSAPDVSTPIEPLWPLSEGTLGVDLVWYNAWWINIGFLAVMVGVHLGLAAMTSRSTDRDRLPTDG
jgi:formate/nitrite transporter FocA (FNT family)